MIIERGLSLVAGTGAAIIAQIPSAEFASEWGKFGATAILGVVCIVTLWISYRSQVKHTESIDHMTSAVGKLCEKMASRPCVMDRELRR